MRAAVASYWPDWVERITGIGVDQLRETVRILAHGAVGDDPHRPRRRAAQQRHRHRAGVHQPRAGARACPASGPPATAPSPARATARAAASTARRPTSCPATGGSTIRRPARTSRRSGASTRTSCPLPGKSAFEMLDRLGTDGRRAGAAGAGVQHRGVRARTRTGSAAGWSALDLLVVSDIFLSETAALADVVLPTAQWAEEDGTMTNLEGRVIRRKQALPPPVRRAGRPADAVRAGRQTRPRPVLLGRPAGGLRRAAAGQRRRHRRLRRASPTSGSTPRRASSGRARRSDHPGTPRMFTDAFPTPDGRARFHPGAAPRTRRDARTPATPTC